MKDFVPSDVRYFALAYCSMVDPRASKATKDAWARFVNDPRMIEVYEVIKKANENPSRILGSAAILAAHDWREIRGSKERAILALEAIQSHAKAIQFAIDDLTYEWPSGVIEGDEKFRSTYGALIGSKEAATQIEANASEVAASKHFLALSPADIATSTRQHNDFTAFWRALRARLNEDADGDFLTEQALPARVVAVICACALGMEEVDEERIKKLRQRTKDN